MAEERESYRWWVLLNTFLVFTIAFGMGWTYIVMVASEVIKDLNLTLVDWGTLWSAVSLGALVFAIIGGALGDRFGVRPIAGLGVVLMGSFLLLRATATDFTSMYT
jgi:MFS family permease